MTSPSYIPSGSSVVVAMSGGVDSSVSALLVKQQGYSAIGVSMQVWDYRNHGGSCEKATCCAPDDFTDARKVAAMVGIPYYVFDFERSFREKVIDNFVATYARGETPNPCVDCNNKVKFKELRDRAAAMGSQAVVTGHYAQIKQYSDGLYLERGVDDEKDQSYFLYNLTPEDLRSTIFPVGHLTKPEVRELAREFNLTTADKPESQDICFVSGPVKEFLVKLGVKQKQGSIVHVNGTVIGTHDGIHGFTVGQRKGVTAGGFTEPQYVLEINPATNQVIVGERHNLERQSFSINQCTWSAPMLLNKLADTTIDSFTIDCTAQLRSRHRGTPVTATISKDGTASISFKDEWAVVSPGQACVLYDGNRVLGGGRIVK